jgi:hypothetical protein
MSNHTVQGHQSNECVPTCYSTFRHNYSSFHYFHYLGVLLSTVSLMMSEDMECLSIKLSENGKKVSKTANDVHHRFEVFTVVKMSMVVY